MAKLSARARRRMSSKSFALSGGRFPIPDKSHAEAAKRLAARSLKKGNISRGEYQKVIAKADKKLGNK